MKPELTKPSEEEKNYVFDRNLMFLSTIFFGIAEIFLLNESNEKRKILLGSCLREGSKYTNELKLMELQSVSQYVTIFFIISILCLGKGLYSSIKIHEFKKKRMIEDKTNALMYEKQKEGDDKLDNLTIKKNEDESN